MEYYIAGPERSTSTPSQLQSRIEIPGLAAFSQLASHEIKGQGIWGFQRALTK